MKKFKIAILAVAALSVAGPAAASVTPHAQSSLVLSVTVGTAAPNGPRPTPKVVTLRCDRDSGSHPTPRAACDLLRKVNGNAANLNVDPGGICTREYIPHTARLLGKWRGRPVSFEKTFGNRCEMIKTTGAVFTF
ncbi:Subtilisin inhibitor-like [Sinosporangium album]|uniref:Subtilisin inhibitor-like n=2 Tax=Sinosporangium album TaxID=504805 RepID=A0A1G8J1V4_9ACTN|nr:Subtilisin inhibitor-like [Sinosporangium album]